MDRVILGKATTNTTSSYYHRSGQQGLFISKPGANVHNCADGDLMFDSTAAGLVQILGKGRASVPKQLYDKGIFGEAGDITEDNWDKPSEPGASPNRKTSWLFGAMDDLKSQLDTFATTSWEFRIVRDSSSSDGAEAGYDPATFNYAAVSAAPSLFGGIIVDPLLLIKIGDYAGDVISYPPQDWAEPFYETLYKNVEDYFRFGDINSDVYVTTMCKNLWRIQNIFPFVSNVPLYLDGFSGYFGGRTKTKRIDLGMPDCIKNPGEIDFFKALRLDKIDELIDANDDDGLFDFISPQWKALWESYIDSNTVAGIPPRYPSTTAYSSEFMLKREPKFWRAWTRPGEVQDEKTAKHLFFQYQYFLSWLYTNFGTYVNTKTTAEAEQIHRPGEGFAFLTDGLGTTRSALDAEGGTIPSNQPTGPTLTVPNPTGPGTPYIGDSDLGGEPGHQGTGGVSYRGGTFDGGVDPTVGDSYGPFDWSVYVEATLTNANLPEDHPFLSTQYATYTGELGVERYPELYSDQTFPEIVAWRIPRRWTQGPSGGPYYADPGMPFWSNFQYYSSGAQPLLSDPYGNVLNESALTHPDFNITAGSTPKNFTEYTSTGNWTYTEWKNGTVDISTGVDAPSRDRPVQIWWNFISRETGNSVTNLTFLNIRDHLAKTSTNSERLTSLKPGVPAITANTYVLNDEVRVKFEQPSTEDTADIYYTIFSENSFPDPSRETVDALVLNITDVDDPNYPGDNYAGRRQIESTWWDGETRSDYGRYYSIVFPDDFVQTKGTETDPFRNHRNSDGVIRDALTITLNIPQGVVLSSNSHAKNIAFTDLEVDPAIGSVFGYSEVNRGSKKYGPPDPAGRHLLEKDAMVDPCIKLNLTSTEFTDQALRAMTIRIENNGTLVGGGGYGQYGQFNMPQVLKNFFKDYPGGGGGGGAGYHPPWRVENPETDWIGATTGTAASYLSAISDTSNTQPATDGTPHPDWVNHYEGVIDDHAQYSLRDERQILFPPTGAELVPGAARDAYFAHLNSLDTSSPATYEGEKDAHRAAIVNHWRGPNNYVEWGMGDVETVSNYGTGMDKITIDSLGPGKPGTGYLGSAPNQSGGTAGYNNVTGFPRWNLERAAGYGYFTTRPYYQGTILEMRDALGRYQKDLYHRIPGTYQLSFSSGTNFWIPRFGPMSIRGKEGTAGTTTSGGSGGIAGHTGVYGTSQDTFNQIGYIGLSALSGQPFGVGRPASGAGGSLVFVHANTTSTISGTSVTLINNEGAIMKSGGGGGSGGSSANGLRGGNLGRPGNWYTGFSAEADVQANSVSATTLGLPTVDTDPAWAWQTYTIRGEPGRLVWWSTSNVASSYSIVNKAKSVDGAVEGLDYNPGTKDWDYVSYLPDIDVTIARKQFIPDQGLIDIQVPWVTTGTKLWGRKLNDDGKVVWTKMNENTFEEYLNDINAVVTE